MFFSLKKINFCLFVYYKEFLSLQNTSEHFGLGRYEKTGLGVDRPSGSHNLRDK